LPVSVILTLATELGVEIEQIKIQRNIKEVESRKDVTVEI